MSQDLKDNNSVSADIQNNNKQEDKKSKIDEDQFLEFLKDKQHFDIAQVGNVVIGTILSVSNSEVKVDIDGVLTGVVRGPELCLDSDESVEVGGEVEVTIIGEENENGELELSFKASNQGRAWDDLQDAYKNKKAINVKVTGANKGGLMANFRQIPGFLPVSQLAPENYPRISGGDRSKIFEKLKSFTGKEIEVKVTTLSEEEDKIIFSEKEAWVDKQRHNISKYKVGAIVEGVISAIADFGVFINFDTNLEGLLHISELAWQRIDHPRDLFKVGDNIKAEIISVNGPKMFLSAKKLMKDPWSKVEEKYKIGDRTQGKIIKVNHFGLFVELDKEIHALAHISQLGLEAKQKVEDVFKVNDEKIFVITSIQAKFHRMGLTVSRDQSELKVRPKKKKEDESKKEKPEVEEKPEKEDKPKKEKEEKVKKDK